MNHARLLVGVGAVAAGSLVAGWVFYRTCLVPRADLIEQTGQVRKDAAGIEARLRDLRGGSARITAVAETTLGSRPDIVEHRFRTGLRRIAEDSGLGGVEVSSGEAVPQRSPVRDARVAGRVGQVLRDRVDFSVVAGQVRGTGTPDQAARTLAALRAQPWVHRVDGFTIRPVGSDRSRVDLTAEVSTIIMAGSGPTTADDAPIAPVSDAPDAPWRLVFARDVFREPPPEVAAAPPPPPPVEQATPAPAPLPYHEWRLTGVVQSTRTGVRALLVRSTTGDQLALAPGESVLDLVFEAGVIDGGAAGRAVFAQGEQKYEVEAGRSLAERRPVESVHSGSASGR